MKNSQDIQRRHLSEYIIDKDSYSFLVSCTECSERIRGRCQCGAVIMRGPGTRRACGSVLSVPSLQDYTTRVLTTQLYTDSTQIRTFGGLTNRTEEVFLTRHTS